MNQFITFLLHNPLLSYLLCFLAGVVVILFIELKVRSKSFSFIDVYNFFGGRSTFFGLLCFIVGTVLAFAQKLTGEFTAFVTVVYGWFIVRTIGEDKYINQQNAGTPPTPPPPS